MSLHQYADLGFSVVVMNNSVSWHETLATCSTLVFVWFSLQPGKWRLCIPSKLRLPFNRLHSLYISAYCNLCQCCWRHLFLRLRMILDHVFLGNVMGLYKLTNSKVQSSCHSASQEMYLLLWNSFAVVVVVVVVVVFSCIYCVVSTNNFIFAETGSWL
jgi:hypothetical protein